MQKVSVFRICECGKTIDLSESGFCPKCNRNYWSSYRGRREFEGVSTPSEKFDEVEREGKSRKVFFIPVTKMVNWFKGRKR